MLVPTDQDRLRAKYDGLLTDAELDELIAGLKQVRRQVFEYTGTSCAACRRTRRSSSMYSNSKVRVENDGHTFGEVCPTRTRRR